MAQIAGRHANADRGPALRAALAEVLGQREKMNGDAVEAAFRLVPRGRLMPDGADLAITYGFDISVVTTRDEHRVAMPSLSAGYIRARMLEPTGRCRTRGRSGEPIAEIFGSGGRAISRGGSRCWRTALNSVMACGARHD
jgi:protein-L-isoaspartate(D-aspartate) O-methyltransferase